MFTCICINCIFYNQCWIKNGLNKLPKVYTDSSIKLTFRSNINNKEFFTRSISFKILLNMFNKKQEYEFDVVECEGFCENPGIWIN
uniref:Uncharacterized protein n=1 Tax=Nannochloropsis gaditana TaxID=72520 RepID=T1RGU7_9STRA|nr:hypothetical protein Ycf34 [Nannochloropsis gaditana]